MEQLTQHIKDKQPSIINEERRLFNRDLTERWELLTTLLCAHTPTHAHTRGK